MFREIEDIMGIFMYLRVIEEKWIMNRVSKVGYKNDVGGRKKVSIKIIQFVRAM